MDGGAGRLPIKWALTTHLVMWQVPRCLKEYEVQKIKYTLTRDLCIQSPLPVSGTWVWDS